MLCVECGHMVPRSSMDLHTGRCRRARVAAQPGQETTYSRAAAQPSSSSGDDPYSAEGTMQSLLPSWSADHLQALLGCHGGNVEEAYNAVSSLGEDPNTLSQSHREAIVAAFHEELAGSPNHSHSKRPRTSSGSPTSLPSFSSYGFRLLQSVAVGDDGNKGAVTLEELVPNTGDLVEAVVFSMMIDFDYLLSQVPALGSLRGEQLTVISGNGQLAGRLPANTSIHYPHLPDYGSHHSKGVVAYYRDRCIIVITTANFLHVDIECKTNGVWSAVAPSKTSSSAPSSELEDDLVRYFDQYNMRAKKHSSGGLSGGGKGGRGSGGKGSRTTTEGAPTASSATGNVVNSARLRQFDFSGIRGVKIIASAPGLTSFGSHYGEEVFNWGHLALRRALANIQRRSGGSFLSSPDVRLLCQFTSMGSTSEKWLYNQFTDSLLGRLDEFDDLKKYGRALKTPKGQSNWIPPVPIELVVPSVEKVRCSTEGYAGGASIPLPAKNIEAVRTSVFTHFKLIFCCLPGLPL